LSDHHKRNKNIISNKKAFSSIVGAIFAILVIVSLTGTFFVWSLQQNNRYVEAVSGVNDLVLYQKSESINVTSVPIYTVEAGGNVLVSVGLMNDGPLSVTIKTLWLQDLNRPTHGKTQLNPATYTLSPGESQPIGESVSVPDAVAGDSFYGWLTTARGTTVQLYPSHQTGPQGEPGIDGTNGTNSYDARTALVAQGIGSLSFDFRSITYFNVVGNQLTPYPDGYRTYSVPATDGIAIGFNITNVNPYEHNVTLDSKSLMWSYFPLVPGQTLGPVWSITSYQSGGTIDSTYSPITLVYNVTQFLVFYNPGRNLFDMGQQNTLAAVNLLFYGNFTTKTGGVTSVVSSYGQNVPFVSLYFYRV
jgi:hypothetical protein